MENIHSYTIWRSTIFSGGIPDLNIWKRALPAAPGSGCADIVGIGVDSGRDAVGPPRQQDQLGIMGILLCPPLLPLDQTIHEKKSQVDIQDVTEENPVVGGAQNALDVRSSITSSYRY